MKSGKKFILTVLIFIFSIVSAAFADTVVLKNGRELKVAKTWQEGDQLCFIFHGMKAGIPQSKISRIENDSDDRNTSIARKNIVKDDLKRIDRKSAEDVTRGQAEGTAQTDSDSSGAVIPTQPCPAIRKDGFCDLQWGRTVPSVEGLRIRQSISDLDDVVEYVRPKDFLKIGDAALESVIYFSFTRLRSGPGIIPISQPCVMRCSRNLARVSETIPLVKGIFGLICSAT